MVQNLTGARNESKHGQVTVTVPYSPLWNGILLSNSLLAM